MDKKEIIKKFLFEGSPEEQKEKFEIAWDIWENLEDIKQELRKNIVKELIKKIKYSFQKDYIIKDFGFSKGGIGFDRELCIFKPEWVVEGERGILSYSFGSDGRGFSKLYIAISKYNEKKPFIGDWKELEKSKVQNISSIAVPLKEWETGDRWIAWKYFDSPYDNMEEIQFYLKIIEGGKDKGIEHGCKNVADYYFNELLNLKKTTESLIDEFIELYKKGLIF